VALIPSDEARLLLLCWRLREIERVMTKRLTSDMQAELIAKRLEHFQDSGAIAAAARIPLPLNVLKYDDPSIGVIPFYRNVNNSELPK